MTKKKTTKKKPATPKKQHEDVFAVDEEDIEKKLHDSSDEVVFEDSFGEQDERFADDLSEIYEEDGKKNQAIDMTTFDQKRKRGKIIAAVIAAVVVLGAITYLGFRVFSSVASDGDSGSVDFAINASQEVASGEVITLELAITNNRTADISGEIELFYPSGFLFQRASVESVNEENTIFSVDTVGEGQSETLSITGQLIGSTDDQKDFSALMTYSPSNFSSDFQENTTASIDITSSLINVTLEGPEQVQSGEEFTLTATLENASDAEMSNLLAQMVYPAGFTPSTTSPEATASNDEWLFESVLPQSSETIAIAGTMGSVESGSTQEFQFQTGLQEADGTFTLQAEATAEMIVVNPEVELTLDVPAVASSGSTVPVTVNIDNTSEATLQAVEIQLSLDTDFFTTDVMSLSITDVAPGETGTVVGEVTIQSDPSASDREGAITATIPSATVEGAVLAFPNESMASIKLQSSFSVTVSGGGTADALEVGETALYAVVWSVENGGETVESFTLSTTLPNGVEWAGDASNGVSYDSGTGTVTYENDQLPGSFERDLSFTVSVTPQRGDVGSTVQLTNETIAFGIDAFTEQDISISQPPVQTNTAVKQATESDSDDE
jgi:hypothetical protein